MSEFNSDLCELLTTPKALVEIRDSSGITHAGYIRGIDCEDCSGHSFNVRMLGLDGATVTFHVRTS